MTTGVTVFLRALWTIVGLVGLRFLIRETIECHRDYKQVQATLGYRVGSARDLKAKQNRRVMFERVGVFAGFTAVGIWALTTPVKMPPTLVGVATSLVIIFGLVLLVNGARLDRKTRLAIYDEEAARPKQPAIWERQADRQEGKAD